MMQDTKPLGAGPKGETFMSKETLHVVTSGGITTPAGFKAAGIHAGFRKNPHRRDLALIVPDKP